jgi:flavin reductase (DIM6/NTAB) family NADH-FMN oxidoreductase RutF
MMLLSSTDILAMEQRYRATFMNSISGFKSLQMVGTISPSGQTNIALFNSIFHIGANPPLIGMICRPDGDQHSTFDNIEKTGFYTLNNVQQNWYKQAHQTSARYGLNQSEFETCGFNEQYLPDFKAPFVQQASVKLGLELREINVIKFNGSRIIIGEVKHIILDNGLVATDGFVDLEKAQSVTVAGLDSYHSTQKLARLKYAKPENQVEELIVN